MTTERGVLLPIQLLEKEVCLTEQRKQAENWWPCGHWRRGSMLEVFHTQTEEAKYYTSNRAADIYFSMSVGLSVQ